MCFKEGRRNGLEVMRKGVERGAREKRDLQETAQLQLKQKGRENIQSRD